MANTRSVTIEFPGALFTSSETGQVLCITRAHLAQNADADEIVDPSSANASKADGGDLRLFIGGTAIPLHVEAWGHDSATGAQDAGCVLKFRADTTAGIALSVEMQWGDAALTQPVATDPLGSRAVWADYGAVYSLVDGGLSDSAGNSGEMSWTGAGGSRAGLVAGTTAPATDGASAMSAMYDADVAGLNPYVIRGWLYIVNDALGYYYGALNGEEGSAGNAVQIDASGSESGNPRYLVDTLGEAGIIVNPSTALFDQWVYIVLAFSATEAAIYENGASIYSAARSSPYPSNTERGLVLFRRAPTSTTNQAAAGAAAQFVQIGGPMPSAGRIATEYNNQNPATAATYVTVGTPTSLGGGVALAPAGMASASALGAASITAQRASTPASMASGAALTVPTTTADRPVSSASMVSPAGMGAPAITAARPVAAGPMASPSSLGAAGLTSTPPLAPAQIASITALDFAALAREAALDVAGLASVATLGGTVVVAVRALTPAAMASPAIIGPALITGVRELAPGGLTSASVLGAPGITGIGALAPAGLDAAVRLAGATLFAARPVQPAGMAAATLLSPAGISAERLVAAAGFVSASSLGAVMIHAVRAVVPAALASATAIEPIVFGTPDVPDRFTLTLAPGTMTLRLKSRSTTLTLPAPTIH